MERVASREDARLREAALRLGLGLVYGFTPGITCLVVLGLVGGEAAYKVLYMLEQRGVVSPMGNGIIKRK